MKNLVNISIDDISPHPMSNEKCLDICFDILKDFPEAKFTLYVPMGYWRMFNDKGFQTKTKSPLYLSDFPDLCKKLKNLPKENFELCYHGVYHNDGICNNNEFGGLSYNDACKRFEKMFDIAKKSNLYNITKKIFRPPNFRMSPESIRAAYDSGIEQLSLHPDKKVKETYDGAYKVFGGNISWFNVIYPWKEYRLYPKTSVVFHACSWSKNYLNEENKKILINFLKNSKDIEFCFAKQIMEKNNV